MDSRMSREQNGGGRQSQKGRMTALADTSAAPSAVPSAPREDIYEGYRSRGAPKRCRITRRVNK